MVHHPRHRRHVLVTAAALLVLLPSLALAGSIINRPRPTPPPPLPPPPRVTSDMVAPQIKSIQDLTDPVLISILPPQVVDRDALYRRPPTPQLVILTPGGGPGGPAGPTAFPRINGMPP